MIFVDDLKNPEAPVLLEDGSFLVVEMHPDRGWVLWLSADGKERRVVKKTGRPNGLAVDSKGLIWVAESNNPPSLRTLTLDGRDASFLEECDGQRFLWPNDMAFGPDGALYLTDSGMLQKQVASMTPEERRSLPVDGRVFRVDTQTKAITKLDEGLKFANGIAFGPDDGFLYVNSTQDGMVWRYHWHDDGSVGPREEFANVRDPQNPKADIAGGDGMKFGMDGNLYVTVANQSDVTVLDPGGEVVRRIKLAGDRPTNLCFGPEGSRKIYVTEQGIGNLEVHDVDCDGWPLLGGPG